MSIRDNDSAKADIDEFSKLKKNRQPLKKKGKIDNISSEPITISPLKIIPEKSKEIKTQEKMETYIPTASLKIENKAENELNKKKKAKQYKNEKIKKRKEKKRQLSKLKSLNNIKLRMI